MPRSGDDGKIEFRNAVLESLNKLNHRDTHDQAKDELCEFVDSCPTEYLPVLLSCLAESNEHQSVQSKRETVRLIGLMASTHRESMASSVSKMITAIVKHLRDKDSATRDYCAESVGLVARYVAPGSRQSLGVFFKPLFQLCSEQNKIIQSGASLCIAKVIFNSESKVVPEVPRLCNRLLKFLLQPNFFAKHVLFTAVSNLVLVVGKHVLPHVPEFLSILLELLASSDWMERRCAAEVLEAFAVHLRQDMNEYRQDILEVLYTRRYDKVKPVRDSVISAIQAYDGSLDNPKFTREKRFRGSSHDTSAVRVSERDHADPFVRGGGSKKASKSKRGYSTASMRTKSSRNRARRAGQPPSFKHMNPNAAFFKVPTPVRGGGGGGGASSGPHPDDYVDEADAYDSPPRRGGGGGGGGSRRGPPRGYSDEEEDYSDDYRDSRRSRRGERERDSRRSRRRDRDRDYRRGSYSDDYSDDYRDAPQPPPARRSQRAGSRARDDAVLDDEMAPTRTPPSAVVKGGKVSAASPGGSGGGGAADKDEDYFVLVKTPKAPPKPAEEEDPNLDWTKYIVEQEERKRAEAGMAPAADAGGTGLGDDMHPEVASLLQSSAALGTPAKSGAGAASAAAAPVTPSVSDEKLNEVNQQLRELHMQQDRLADILSQFQDQNKDFMHQVSSRIADTQRTVEEVREEDEARRREEMIRWEEEERLRAEEEARAREEEERLIYEEEQRRLAEEEQELLRIEGEERMLARLEEEERLRAEEEERLRAEEEARQREEDEARRREEEERARREAEEIEREREKRRRKQSRASRHRSSRSKSRSRREVYDTEEEWEERRTLRREGSKPPPPAASAGAASSKSRYNGGEWEREGAGARDAGSEYSSEEEIIRERRPSRSRTSRYVYREGDTVMLRSPGMMPSAPVVIDANSMGAASQYGQTVLQTGTPGVTVHQSAAFGAPVHHSHTHGHAGHASQFSHSLHRSHTMSGAPGVPGINVSTPSQVNIHQHQSPVTGRFAGTAPPPRLRGGPPPSMGPGGMMAQAGAGAAGYSAYQTTSNSFVQQHGGAATGANGMVMAPLNRLPGTTVHFNNDYHTSTGVPYNGDYNAVTEIDYSHNNIVLIEGLEWYPNLYKVNLSQNKLENLFGIDAAQGLRDVNLSNNRLKTVDGLQYCRLLQEIHLENNLLRDVSTVLELSTLPYLTFLDISNNDFNKHAIHEIKRHFTKHAPLCKLVTSSRSSGGGGGGSSSSSSRSSKKRSGSSRSRHSHSRARSKSRHRSRSRRSRRRASSSSSDASMSSDYSDSD